MDWNKRWDVENQEKKAEKSRNSDHSIGATEQKKWNYIFLESLKMGLFLPIVILFTEIFILGTWSNIREAPLKLVFDYMFLFSMIFLIFVVYHLFRWHRLTKRTGEG